MKTSFFNSFNNLQTFSGRPLGFSLTFVPLLLVFLFSCVRTDPSGSVENANRQKRATINSRHSIVNESGDSFFYGIYSPDEISGIFKDEDFRYSPEILAPVENVTKITGTSKIALNLGVFGADFSITKLFNNTEAALSYMDAISFLSGKLGIPEDIFKSSVNNIEKHADNIDSLSLIVNQSFEQISGYLMENDRENSFSLILLGGWTESLYLAIKYLELTENSNEKIIEKIVQQKYALNFLLSMLKNNYHDPAIAAYYQQYKVLQNHFDKMNFQYKSKNVQMDTVNKVIHSSWSKLNYNNEDLVKLKRYILFLRESIISL
jgi:hypothetical protein